MGLSVLFPKHLLHSTSGVLIGEIDESLNCYCIVTVLESYMEDVFLKHSNSNVPMLKVLGFQQCKRTFDKILIHFKIYQTTEFSIEANLKNCESSVKILRNFNGTGQCAKRTLLFLYDQKAVHCGIQSHFDWSCSDDLAVHKQVVSSYNEDFGVKGLDLIEFLYKSTGDFNQLMESNSIQAPTDFKVSKSFLGMIVLKISVMLFLIACAFEQKMSSIPFPKEPLSAVRKILSISSFGSQFFVKVDLIKDLSGHNKKLTKLLKSDILSGMCVDICLGVLFYLLVSGFNGTFDKYTFNVLMSSISYIGKEVQQLIEWLMGIPIGLKLNSPLNQFLGKFFLHHVQLWLEYIQMLLSTLNARQEYFMHWPLFASCFGLSLFVAFLSDIVSLLSFHIYCFYVYGARLYRLQFFGLMSFWRLFRGKKWNPLRQRVDTLQDTGEGENPRFFLGTLLFTILLFLLPTTAMYYSIFAALRISIMFVQNFLAYAQKILCCFPWCTLICRHIYPLRFPALAQINFVGMHNPITFLPKEEYYQIDANPPTTFTVLIKPQTYSRVVSKALTKLRLHYGQSDFHSLLIALVTGRLLKWN